MTPQLAVVVCMGGSVQEPSSAHVWCSGTPHVFAEFVHVLSKLDAILAGVAQRVAVRSAWNPPLHARGVETAVPSARKCRAECTLSEGHAECTREQAEHQSQSTVNRHLFLLSPGLLDLRRSTQISSSYNYIIIFIAQYNLPHTSKSITVLGQPLHRDMHRYARC